MNFFKGEISNSFQKNLKEFSILNPEIKFQIYIEYSFEGKSLIFRVKKANNRSPQV